MNKAQLGLATALLAACTLNMMAPSTNAQSIRRGFQNANGTRGGLFRTNGVKTGPFGGRYRAGAAGAWNPNLGGAGAYGQAGYGPQGNPYYRYGAGAYNKQTGTGFTTKGEQATVNGQNYGAQETTQFTKGQGLTKSIATDNKGDYTVNWTPGSKPTYQQTAPPGAGAPNMPPASSAVNTILNAPVPAAR